MFPTEQAISGNRIFRDVRVEVPAVEYSSTFSNLDLPKNRMSTRLACSFSRVQLSTHDLRIPAMNIGLQNPEVHDLRFEKSTGH